MCVASLFWKGHRAAQSAKMTACGAATIQLQLLRPSTEWPDAVADAVNADATRSALRHLREASTTRSSIAPSTAAALRKAPALLSLDTFLNSKHIRVVLARKPNALSNESFPDKKVNKTFSRLCMTESFTLILCYI